MDQIILIGWSIFGVSIIALIFAFILTRLINKKSPGTDRMKEISQYIQEGAMAYLKQQYKVVGIFFVLLFIILFCIAYIPKFMTGKATLLSIYVPYAFLIGGILSGLSGFFGMRIATKSNARTAYAASESLNKGLRVAFNSGTVMAMSVVGLGLLYVSGAYLMFKYIGADPKEIAQSIISFGMGASFVALFARLGGGIFTKAADVGADLVGKVEAGIPEDDPRNPATIADNVGDNVGDVAGMGADLFESYVGSIIAAVSLGYFAVVGMVQDITMIFKFMILPLAIAGIGIVCSILGSFLVRTKENATQKSLLAALRIGVYSSTIITMIGSGLAVYFLLGKEYWGLIISIVIGLIAGNVIGYFTEYYTSDHYKPTKNLSDKANSGAGPIIIGGLAIGMESTMIPVITIILGIMGAYFLPGGGSMGLFGVGLAAVGMLSTLGITLATDAYGPVADNAGGIAEMAGMDPKVRERTDALDSLGNTTAATGKGFAIGSAALTTLALLVGFNNQATEILGKDLLASITNPFVLVGLFIGAMLPFLFSAMSMGAVGRAAQAMVEEVRRQFKEKKGILEGKEKPDYQNCVKISTLGAQKEMILPSLLAIISPLLVGIIFGPSAVLALLAGSLVSGFALAIMMANSGGSWDNAKKYIESGHHGGKGSNAHKAAVVGDTVGDPFKDTSGPSLNILLKLMSMVSIVFVGTSIALNNYIVEFITSLLK